MHKCVLYASLTNNRYHRKANNRIHQEIEVNLKTLSAYSTHSNTFKIMDNQYLNSIPSSKDREKNDNYATNPIATQLLLNHEKFYPKVLEPCCGQGCISKILQLNGYEVISCDLNDYGYGHKGIDFLKEEDNDFINSLKGEVDIVTNVPYKFTYPMLGRALDICRNKVCMLFPISYLTKFHFCPPTLVYIFTRRIDTAKGGEFSKYPNGGMKDFCWMVWYKGFKGETTIRYIDNSKAERNEVKELKNKLSNSISNWNLCSCDLKQHIKKLYENDKLPKREIARIRVLVKGLSENG